MAERKKVKKVSTKKNLTRTETNKKTVSSKPKGGVRTKNTAAAKIPMASTKTSNTAADKKVKQQPVHKISKTESSSKNNLAKKMGKTAADRPKSTSAKNVPSRNIPVRFKLLKGNKLEYNRKRFLLGLSIAVIIISVIIFSSASPTGPFEKITNSFAINGAGSYPVSVTGTEVNSFKTVGNKVFALTDSHFCGYNFSGKTFIDLQHDFSNPVLETSKERCLIYNRESTGYIIANNSSALYEGDVENHIYCADIADNGTTAFATKTTGYAAEVIVFKRGMKQAFSWYLAEGLVSDVALSNNGKYLAVSVLKVKNGVFTSEIYCFKISSDKTVFSLELSDQSVIKLEALSNKNFAVISDKKLSFVQWKNGTHTVLDDSELSPAFYKESNDGGALAVFSNHSIATLVKYNQKGIKKFSFEYNGLIDDVAIYGDNIYILKGNKIYYFNSEGQELGVANLSQIASYIVGHKSGVLAADSLRISLHKGEK